MATKDLNALRQHYSRHELDESQVHPSPLEQLKIWVEEAIASQLPEPNAMTMATVTESGQPTTRVVLLKEIRPQGLVFYTNYESRKGLELSQNPLMALNFLWLELERQVRIEGVAVKLSHEESLAYFQARPRESQIGAWASYQSQSIPSRVILEKRFHELQEKYADEPALPLPPFWGGYVVEPSLVEFWQGRASRLHDRVQYRRTVDQWFIERLQP
jgi:pyridoxamine 5'-phosphate oxidase